MNRRDNSYIVKNFRNNKHFEHDDRSSRGSRHRQGQYKSFARGRHIRNLDDDTHMSSVSNRFGGREDRRGMSLSGRNRAGRRGVGGTTAMASRRQTPTLSSQHFWFQVEIPYGRNYGKDFVMKSFKDNLTEPFYPIWYAEDSRGRDSSFYIEGQQNNDSIVALDQRIQTPNGYKMKIMSRRCSPPMMDVDDDVKNHLKLSLSNRYRSDNRTLDLSQFSNDTHLREQGLFMPLYRQPVVSAVVDIIAGNIPDVVGINLSGNRLNNLTLFKPLQTACCNLIALNLSKNWIPAISMLDALGGLALVELNLDGNKLCNSFKRKAEYVSAVRKRFPKVVLLDDVELPPPVKFDLDDSETEIKLPPPCRTFFSNAQYSDIVLAFLKQYFEVFDSDKRDALVDAYHDCGNFSLSVVSSKASGIEKFQSWVSSSRNVLRVSLERATSLLRCGKLSVVGALARLPASQHDTSSFSVDVPLANERLMQAVVTGVFREREEKHQPIRAFSRSFILVPFGAGLCIVNDMLQIQHPTSEQIKGCFRVTAPTPSPSPVPTAPSAAPAAIQSRDEMIRSFCAFSGMNLEWSTKCLEENAFNLEASAQSFNRLKLEGKIPDAAFVQAPV